MADGTMFIPVQPLHKGATQKRAGDRQYEEEESRGLFSCCGERRFRRRPSADMVYDEAEGVYTLKDGTMYTPIKPEKTNDPEKSVIWRNAPDVDSKNWFIHHGGYAGEIKGPKSRKYDPRDVEKFGKEDFKSDKQNGHWFLGNPDKSNNNRNLVTTSLRESHQKPTTVYVVDEDPRLKEHVPSPRPKSPVTPKAIVVQSPPQNVEPQPRAAPGVIVVHGKNTDKDKNNAKDSKDDNHKDNFMSKDDNEKNNKKQGKSKSDTKIVVINVNHRDKGRSKSKNNEKNPNDLYSDKGNNNDDTPVVQTNNYVTRSLDDSHLPLPVSTPSDTGTRDTFSMADVNDLINSGLINDTDGSTDEEGPHKINPDSSFVDAVNRELILEKMRKKKRNDKVWIPHSHPVRNSKHFTK
ncbi:AAC-rich mRNA clone AAC11 protein [Patella vulgata]|uniref:AAC-rich mRNA clone AAC11 protein n=1 Tax=Patella vulgata TaxID=6465 RepID=UPI00217FFC13|nr:AAC-rich mRNA clone AAC11 protein [Patella vulgata]